MVQITNYKFQKILVSNIRSRYYFIISIIGYKRVLWRKI